jgi:hypothetical protein
MNVSVKTEEFPEKHSKEMSTKKHNDATKKLNDFFSPTKKNKINKTEKIN